MAIINENVQKILEERYFYKNPNTGETLEKTAEDMFRRVARVVALAEKEEDRGMWENTFYELMNEQIFMPNTPTLIGAGYKDKCLSACSVIGEYPDSLDGIYDYLKLNALLTKSGAGVGQSLSKIRPKGAVIKSSGGLSAGVVNWMTLINTVAETTRQGDKARRAANMVALRFNHPDIIDFIMSKRNNSDFTNMNISITITDDEMNKVINDEDIDLVWEETVFKTVKARSIFDLIVDNMYNHGDPGVLFLDSMNRENPFNLKDGTFDNKNKHWYTETNPCGEQTLESMELCNLGSTEVSKLYNPITKQVDWELFKSVIEKSIRFLDDVIDQNTYLPEFKEKALGSRKIGLGITGYAELLVKLGIKYDSQEHLNFIDIFFKFKQECEQAYSHELALEKGNAPFWKDSVWEVKGLPMRNLCRNSYAPTGSISSILNTTSFGIEPYFMVCYKRRVMDGEFYEANKLFMDMLHEDINDTKLEQEIMKECYVKGTNQLDCVPKRIRDIFRCANDISPDWHIKVQAQMQKYCDTAISKTVNIPENYPKEGLDNLIINTWKQGIVGTTIYRNNSLQNQTIQIGNKELVEECKSNLDTIKPIKRKDFGRKTQGSTTKYETACGSFYLTINKDKEGHIVESFVNTSKNGTCKSNLDGLNRMISLALRSGTQVNEIIDQLKGITCSACTRVNYKGIKAIDGLSCPDIIAKSLLEEYSLLNTSTAANESKDTIKITSNSELTENSMVCPDCKSVLIRTEGCIRCTECTYSKC